MYKKLGIFTDLSEMDEVLFEYAQELDKKFNFTSIHFIHFIALEELTKDILEMLPKLEQPLDKFIEQEIREATDDLFTSKTKIKINIHEGGEISDLIDNLQSEKFDLLLMGKKSTYQGTGSFSSKIVRLLDCPILLAPEISRPVFNKIVVPYDFSEHSFAALRIALAIAEHTDAQILPVSAIKIGVQYFPYIQNEEEIRQRLEQDAISDFNKLRKKYNIKSELNILHGAREHVGKAIYKFCVKNQGDLIVVGKKGRTDSSDLLIGSVAERLIGNDKVVPVLIA